MATVVCQNLRAPSAPSLRFHVAGCFHGCFFTSSFHFFSFLLSSIIVHIVVLLFSTLFHLLKDNKNCPALFIHICLFFFLGVENTKKEKRTTPPKTCGGAFPYFEFEYDEFDLLHFIKFRILLEERQHHHPTRRKAASPQKREKKAAPPKRSEEKAARPKAVRESTTTQRWERKASPPKRSRRRKAAPPRRRISSTQHHQKGVYPKKLDQCAQASGESAERFVIARFKAL